MNTLRKTRQHDGAVLPEAKTLPADGYSRWAQLKNFVPISRETVRVRELAGKFPKRVSLGKRCAAWPNREIHRWMADPENYAQGACQE